MAELAGCRTQPELQHPVLPANRCSATAGSAVHEARTGCSYVNALHTQKGRTSLKVTILHERQKTRCHSLCGTHKPSLMPSALLHSLKSASVEKAELQVCTQ
jgi:hypothetical protein